MVLNNSLKKRGRCRNDQFPNRHRFFGPRGCDKCLQWQGLIREKTISVNISGKCFLLKKNNE